MVRIKAFIPLISPVVMSSLINTKERALALEVRGFNATNKKTFLNDQKRNAADRYIEWSLIVVMILALVWRILKWQVL